MNKKLYITGISLAMLSLASCSDFLDREPLDFGSEVAYYDNLNDVIQGANQFYQDILPKNETWYGGIFNEDNSSDNQMGTSPDPLFYEGEKRTVEQNVSEWDFKNLRGINYFINRVESQISAGALSATEVNHCLGEGYFFRAWEHFRLLRNFGDAPILTGMLSDDEAELAEATRRHPRNEVARFIISDLTTAVSLMDETAPESGRLCRDAASMLMARVALYEGTWEKYHAGTAFVPGNDKWVGRAMYPNYVFPAGTAEDEYRYFLQVALEASETVAENRPNLDIDYLSMFNNTGVFPDNDEVILARYYLSGVLYHSVGQYLGRSGGGTGLTRSLVNSFLMKDGLPIYASSATMPYGGDADMVEELANRDGRLAVKAAVRNIVETPDPSTGAMVRDTIAYFAPHITNNGNERNTTGYEMYKWVSYEENQQLSGQGTTANPIFRSAEAMLTYLEAYCELNGNVNGGHCDTYWRKLRSRAGVDEDYNKTIQATDLTQENDLAVMSKGQYVSATLYNIRRERRCEFYAEGMRLDDLKRWRALDNMRNYQVEGMNLWNDGNTDCMANNVWPKADGNGTSLEEGTMVSAPGLSTYMRPLQITSTLVTYSTGYNFPKPHYLEPIPIAEFQLATVNGQSTLYQNPGWPTNSDGIADYGYDCD